MTTTPELADVEPTVSRRTLGAWSLASSLITPPLAIVVLGPIYLAFDAGTMDPWVAFGVFMLGVVVFSVFAVILGVVAIVLGSLAARRKPGRGLGIAGIVFGVLGIVSAVLTTLAWIP